MKKFLSVLLTAVLVLSAIPMAGVADLLKNADFSFLSVRAFAASDEWEYEILDDDTACITLYNGSEVNVVIPASVDNHTVSSFGNRVFYNCIDIESVVIPDTVTALGTEMFYNCTSLQRVVIPDSVTTIGEKAFYNCASLSDVTLPGSVTTISTSAFYKCTALTEFTVPASVKTVGSYAFSLCENISKVTVEDLSAWFSIDFGDETATPLYYGADFYLGDTKIVELTIPEDVTTLKKYAMCGNTSVTKVIIPATLRALHYCSFYQAKALLEFDVSVDNTTFFDIDGILYGKAAYTIGSASFDYKYGLINCPNGKSGEVIIPDNLDIAGIGPYAFYDCDGITSVVFPNSMTRVEYYAFNNCSNLKTVDFGDNLKVISYDSFENCTALEAAVFPDTLTALDIDAFVSCISLETVVLGNSLTYIANRTFYGCSSLKNLELNDKITRIGQSGFYNCGMETLELPASLAYISDHAFAECKNLKSVVFNSESATIGSSVFYYCTSLESAVFPKYVSEISSSVFYHCSKLDGFIIPEDVTKIGALAFEYCSSLSSIEIPDMVTDIEGYAFSECTSLTAIDLPDSVETIGKRAFKNCSALETASLSENLKSIGDEAFDYCSSLKELRLPASLESTYTTFDHTNSLERFIVDEGNLYYSSEDGVLFNKDKTILYNYPSGATRTSYFVPTSVVVIGPNSFFETAELDEVTILDNVTTIDKDANFDIYGHDNYKNLLIRCLPDTEAELYATNRRLNKYLIHYYSDWIYDVEPTCTTPGSGHRICEDCGDVEYRDFAELGHSYSPEWTVDIPATCTADGVKSHHCTRVDCDSVSDETAIPATGHNFSAAWTVDVPATCLGNGSKSHHCLNCDEKTDDTVVYALGHVFGGWVINQEPTCTESGTKTHGCEACDFTETVTIESLGHNYSAAWTVDVQSTCTTAGSKSHHCLNCDEKTDVTEIPAGEHLYGAWTVTAPATCDEDGVKTKVCEICGDELTETIPATGHNYSSVWTIDTPASCLQTGIKSHHCLNCDARKDVSRIAATGHSFGTWIIDTEETCLENGLQHRCCASCDETEERIILALGHHYSKMWTVDIESTCTAMGEKSHHCLRCDDRTDIMPIDYSGHVFGPWYIETPSTIDSEGVRAHDCYNCDLIERAPIPKQAKYTATFKADGEIVATVSFPIGADSIEEPEVPVKDKYTGVWSDYVLGDADITVNAIYTPIESEKINNISSDNSGTYSNGIVNVNIHTASPSRTVVTSSSTPVPLDVVLVLDQSGSMAGAKKTALINAVTQFSNTVLNDAKEKNVEHRLAIVGFGMGQDSYGTKGRSGYIPAYGNTEILTTGGTPVAYNAANADSYANALVSVNSNGSLNAAITKAIGNIDAEGATRADLGLEMAAKIFANNEAEGRQRVVVFFTDGEPTSSNSFEYSVANSAIQNAYQIKDTYKANIYSVGIFDKATASNTAVQTFMDAVSSNKLEEVKLNSRTKYPAVSAGGFNITVNDTENLSGIFTSIAEEAVIHTGLFDNLTIVETVSNAFSLTSAQENALRLAAKEKLDVDNGDVVITRNTNGTTRIEIRNIHPTLVNEEYVADISFAVTANENTLYSGTYTVNTLDSGVKVDGGENYEAVFAPMKVNVDGTVGIAVFNINGVPYEIDRLSSSEYVMAPAVDFDEEYTFSGWDIPANCKLNNKAQIFESTLADNEYTVTWNINGEITTETYGTGDVITVPEVYADDVGGNFAGWDGEIPETMPGEDLVFTAVYNGAHYHKYEVTKNFTSCTEGGTLVYTCECGDSYTETIEPCEHTWVANSGAASEENSATVGFRCSVCGTECDNSLEYIRVDKEQASNGSGTATYEFDFINEDGNKEQPDGDVIINVPLDECFENEVPDTSTGKAYRDNGNGSWSSVYAWFNGMNAQITTNHFSTYIFDFSETDKHIFSAVGSQTDIDFESGCIFSQKREVNTLATIISYLLPWNIEAEKDGAFFGTGSSVTLTNSGNEENYTVIINGDVNGDGVCDVLDVTDTERFISGHKTATTYEAYAVNGFADEEISAEDYGTIVNAALAG